MKAAALPGYSVSGKVSVGSTGTLAVAVGGAGQWSATDISTLGANATITGALAFDTTGGNFTYSSILGTANTLLESVTKLGPNTLTLDNGGNVYRGGTNINGGTLAIGSNTALSSGAIFFGGGTLQFTTGSRATMQVSSAPRPTRLSASTQTART